MEVDALKRGVLQRDGEKLLREPVMRLDSARAALSQAVRAALDSAAVRVNEARAVHKAHHPARVLERRVDYLTNLRRRFERAATDPLDRRHDRLARMRGLLRALGPESAFQRGFSITLGPDGKAVRSAASLKPGDVLRTKFQDGETSSRVLD
jgi:exodeoxyribonuclease VII large subunit